MARRSDQVIIELGSCFGHNLEMPNLKMNWVTGDFAFELCKSRSALKSVSNLSPVPASSASQSALRFKMQLCIFQYLLSVDLNRLDTFLDSSHLRIPDPGRLPYIEPWIE
jgi:hypothetical protein